MSWHSQGDEKGEPGGLLGSRGIVKTIVNLGELRTLFRLIREFSRVTGLRKIDSW